MKVIDMKNSVAAPNGKKSFRLLRLGLALAAAQVLPAHATVYTLADGNSSADVNVNTAAGMSDWLVNGQNVLNQQWFWFGIGNGAQQSIDTIYQGFSQPANNVLTTTYGSVANSFSLSITYTLAGGTPNTSDPAGLTEIIAIKNNGSQPLPIRFYQYADFRLGDTVRLSLSGVGSEALVSSSGEPKNNVDTEITRPEPTHGEAAAYGQTLNGLNSGSPYTLNDNLSFKNNDAHATWALEWDLSVTNTLLISKVLDASLVNPIPEPASLSVVGLGVLVFGGAGLARRRNRAHRP